VNRRTVKRGNGRKKRTKRGTNIGKKYIFYSETRGKRTEGRTEGRKNDRTEGSQEDGKEGRREGGGG
jgi:hypothetical protein